MQRYVSRDEQEDVHFAVPQFAPEKHRFDLDQSNIARAGFGRGLCMLSDDVIAAGSSPSTIALHDLNKITGAKVTLTLNKTRHSWLAGVSTKSNYKY